MSRNEHREELRREAFTRLRQEVIRIYWNAQEVGHNATHISALLCSRVKRTHEFRQMGRSYQDQLDGFMDGFETVWERAYLEDRWVLIGEENEFTYLTNDQVDTRHPARDKYRYLGRFVKGTDCHYDRGEEPDWVLARDGLFYAGEGVLFGGFGTAKRFCHGQVRHLWALEKEHEARWVPLRDILLKAIRNVLDHRSPIEVAREVFSLVGDDHRVIWENPEKLAAELSPEFVADWYVRLLDAKNPCLVAALLD